MLSSVAQNQEEVVQHDQEIVPSKNLDPTQVFTSNLEVFRNLKHEEEFSKYTDLFKEVALNEGWDILIQSTRRDNLTRKIVSFTIKCFMHDKNSKRNTQKAKRPLQTRRSLSVRSQTTLL